MLSRSLNQTQTQTQTQSQTQTHIQPGQQSSRRRNKELSELIPPSVSADRNAWRSTPSKPDRQSVGVGYLRRVGLLLSTGGEAGLTLAGWRKPKKPASPEAFDRGTGAAFAFDLVGSAGCSSM